ncbi:MAG: glycerophosphodiester phosphodiesterase [Lachnospiraceae bacterium]|nr:glycerophosphodiester phosphodiesterase [Lachnospiraceae bacterium]
MSKALTKILAALPVAAAAAAGGSMLMVGPGKYSEKAAAPFRKRCFAHRGLYSEDQSVPENSLEAFGLAVEKEYGIELDIQLSKDGEIIVFHDDDLKRACGVDRPVPELTLAELRELRLFGTDQRIPLFSEVLSLTEGKVPLIVELKTQGPRNEELCLKARDLLLSYRGSYCVESFDPRIVRWFRMNAPWVFRGQLACPKSSYNDDTPPAAKELFSRCLCNFYGRPQFIAYEVGGKPASVRLAEAMGAFRVCWTSHCRADHAGNDAVIFEHYLP